MPRFFIRKNAVADLGELKKITISGDDARHISRSLRMAEGDKITVCDMQKTEYICTIEKIDSDTVTLRVVSEANSDTEPNYFVDLYQAVPKGEKSDIIVQKAVECGVHSITFFSSEHCIAKIPPDSVSKKLLRWQKIAEEAAKQCGRGIIPEIRTPVNFKDAVLNASKTDLPIFCYEGDDTIALRDICREYSNYAPDTISIVIGSEGGFSLDETETARQLGMKLAGLGKRILRTETASSFVLACLSYEFEKF